MSESLTYAELAARAMSDRVDRALDEMINGYDVPLRFARIRRWLGLATTKHVPGFGEVVGLD